HVGAVSDKVVGCFLETTGCSMLLAVLGTHGQPQLHPDCIFRILVLFHFSEIFSVLLVSVHTCIIRQTLLTSGGDISTLVCEEITELFQTHSSLLHLLGRLFSGTGP